MDSPYILIVDDDESVLRVLDRQLGAMGHATHTALSAREGLAALARLDVGVVLSDYLMPDMTGLEFLKIARKRRPRAVRIMLTGHAELDAAVQCINSGQVFRFLMKPWDYTTLQLTIRAALEKHKKEHLTEELFLLERRKSSVLEALERECPGILEVQCDDNGAVVLS